eukprot:gene6544-8991_t
MISPISRILAIIFTLELCNSLMVNSFSRYNLKSTNVRNSAFKMLNINDIVEDSLDEIITPKACTIQGEIPSFLKGTLIRNGPGAFGSTNGNRRFTHVFDGLAKLTRYEIDSSDSVKFTTKFIRSNWFNKIVGPNGDIPPCITAAPLSRPYNFIQNLIGVITQGDAFDNANVNIHQFGGNDGPWIATTDAPVLVEFDPVSLDTVKKIKFPNTIVSPKGGVELFCTAHPHTQASKSNPSTVYTYNIFTEFQPFGTTNLVHVVRLDKDFNRVIVGTIEVGKGVVPYIHDFSLVDDYVVLCVWPIRINMDENFSGKGFMPTMKWFGAPTSENNWARDGTEVDDIVNTKIYVFDITKFDKKVDSLNKLDPIAYYESIPALAYHHVNAFIDDQKNIVFDVTGYTTPDIVNSPGGFMHIPFVKNAELRGKAARAGNCHRWTIPIPTKNEAGSDQSETFLKGKFIKPVKLSARDDSGTLYETELVRINENFRGKKYRYSYGYTAFGGSGPDAGGYLDWVLVKQDHTVTSSTSASAVVWRSPSCYPSEPVFVPREKITTDSRVLEDDGVILSQVYDGLKRETFLLVLNAKDMTEIARCYTGTRIPISFHGDFLSSK